MLQSRTLTSSADKTSQKSVRNAMIDLRHLLDVTVSRCIGHFECGVDYPRKARDEYPSFVCSKAECYSMNAQT